ncbi:MAG: hypothetical protein COT90_05830 [Candidatus Diapherotrites archaeon CG10_big_fil_rev_8_21_14_0_10_31_34]|nr:MAG: hypothetical protein COT90_05830 [Candidatus Diapherotrites archaeon CG10_big_fil_rev_8_21_14_0_10_31_34]
MPAKQIKPMKKFKARLVREESKNSVDSLKHTRKMLRYGVSAGIVLGGATGLFEPADLFNKHLIKSALTRLFAGAIVGRTMTFVAGALEIRKATVAVKKELKKEAKSNFVFNNFLKNYKFIFIDAKGNIVGTNKPRKKFLGIKFGRLRIETKDLIQS